jgi:magnesium-transporting ATPase (P-type)
VVTITQALNRLRNILQQAVLFARTTPEHKMRIVSVLKWAIYLNFNPVAYFMLLTL